MRQRWRGRRKLVSLDLTDVRKAVLKPAKLEEAYGAAWAALGIDGALLADPELDEEDLQELGVAVRLHRRRLLKDVARLRAQGVPEDVLEPTPREEPAAPAEPLPQRTVPRSVAAARAAGRPPPRPAVVPAAAADRRGLRAQAGQAAGPEGRRAGGRRRRPRPGSPASALPARRAGQGQTDEGRRATRTRGAGAELAGAGEGAGKRAAAARQPKAAAPKPQRRPAPAPAPKVARAAAARRRREFRRQAREWPRRRGRRRAAPRRGTQKARGPAPGPDVKDDDPRRAEARRTEGVRLRSAADDSSDSDDALEGVKAADVPPRVLRLAVRLRRRGDDESPDTCGELLLQRRLVGLGRRAHPHVRVAAGHPRRDALQGLGARGRRLLRRGRPEDAKWRGRRGLGA